METVVLNWRKRILSLRGKRLVINQLVLSQRWFLAQVIQIPDTVINRVERLVADLLWNEKPPKVIKPNLHLPVEEGGLGILEVRMKIESLHLRLVGRLFHSKDSPWRDMAICLLNKTNNRENLGLSLFHSVLPNSPTGVSPYYRDVLKAYNSLDNIDR